MIIKIKISQNVQNVNEIEEKVKLLNSVMWCNNFVSDVTTIFGNTTDRYTPDVSRVNVAVEPKRTETTHSHITYVIML